MSTTTATPSDDPQNDQPAPEEPLEHRISFWQQPWVQNVLPFVTSVVLHVALIAIGYATFKTVQKVYNTVVQEQVIVPDAALAENGPPGGIVNPGAGTDSSRQAMQNLDDSVTQSQGFSNSKSSSLTASLAGGASGENDDSTIGIGANSSFGKGKGGGAGKGDALGVGSGDGGGVLAPFGTPGGGGGIGPKAPFAGMGGNAHKIVYLLDASGSMRTVKEEVKAELKKSVGTLVPLQFFNVVCFAEQATIFNKNGLIIASPDNKKKLYEFIDDNYVTSGTTNPNAAIEAAFANKPELMYVLTDGFDNVDSTEAVYQKFASLNPDKKVKVNAILLSDDLTKDASLVDLMKRIAAYSGGQFKVVSKDQF